MHQRVLLVDGNYLLFRSYFATARKLKESSHSIPNMRTESGFPINAVFVFLKYLLRMVNKLNITHLLIAFDSEHKSFRHKVYENYKSTRKPPPLDLCLQIPIIKRILDNLNFSWVEKEGLEADDIIATFVYRFEKNPKAKIFILTQDQDMGQLVSPQVAIVTTVKGRLSFINNSNFYEREHFFPHQVCDFKALVGDVSDNIRGVPGIGKMTAIKLLEVYSGVEEILKNIDQLPPKLQKILEFQSDFIFGNKQLVTLVVDESLFENLSDGSMKFRPLTIPLSILLKELEKSGFFPS